MGAPTKLGDFFNILPDNRKEVSLLATKKAAKKKKK
jgi:hypothetical protein